MAAFNVKVNLDAESERRCAELYRRHQARAFRTAVALLGDRSAADALQEAFVNAFRTLGRKRADVAFSTWLYRCLVWAARSQARRRGREIFVSEPPVRTADSELERSELRLGLVAALAEIPREYREVLVLRYYLDLDEKQVASLVGCREGTVKSRAHRGLRMLAASGRLAGYDTGGRRNAESRA